eukprot:scaffold2256_cov131-Skeletonema_marinoi.AAC.1
MYLPRFSKQQSKLNYRELSVPVPATFPQLQLLLPTYPVQAFQASHSPSHLSALYEGESVVLTGATGFVGLRTLKTLLMHTEVDNIILPIRVKGDAEDEEAAIKRFSNVLSKYGEGLDLSIENPRLCFVPMSSGKYLDGISRAPKIHHDKYGADNGAPRGITGCASKSEELCNDYHCFWGRQGN